MNGSTFADLVQSILDNGETLFLLVGGTIALTAIILGTIGSTIRSISRERTRREIAAFISEGSMTPEQGEKLMRAGSKHT